MFMKYFTFILSLISVTMAKPQLITFKDGKIGVNFLGFNAEAGLGGLLTGNAAHGGLSASAGTPFGQRAAAGIGGVNSEGATFGGAFAGATAGEGISARAGLGGRVGGGGALAAEASAGGVSSGVVRTIGSSVNEETPVVIGQENTFDVNTVPQGVTVVQKIKPPKKYSGVNVEKKHQVFAAPVQYSKVKTISAVPVQSAQGSIVKQQTVTAQGQVNAQNFFDGIFNIPISTLRAVNDFLNQGLGQGSLSVRKTVNVQQQH